MMLNSPSATEVVVRKLIRAPIERVFAAWTDPATMAAWMRPASFGSSDVRMDFRVGGAYRIVMRKGDDARYWHEGVYTEISAPTRIAFTWRSHIVADDSEVSVDFASTAGGTEVVLRHRRLADETVRASHTGGWTEILGNLDQHFAGPTAPAQGGFELELPMAAPVARVYAAITEERMLRSWWTATCDVGACGGLATFRFGTTSKTMRIEQQIPDREVRWRCIEANLVHPAVKRRDEWVGTTIVFSLEAITAKSTLLRFFHLGLVPGMECYDLCSAGWAHHLGNLRSFAESGKVTPHVCQPG